MLKYVQLLTELIYLPLSKLASKYGKRIVLFFHMHCVKLKEFQSDHFPIHF